MRNIVVTILTAQLAVYAQQTAPPAAVPKGGVKFEATSQLVVVNVSARGKNGESLDGLKASDFTVTEDGKTQQIKVFEYQRMEDGALPAPAPATRDAGAATAAALKFLGTQMTQADLVAIMTYSTDLQVLQDFTADRDRLTRIVGGLSVGETGMANGSTGDDSEGDTGAAYTQDSSEFNIFNTDRKLAALESAVKMLGNLPEKKQLVY